MRPQRGKHSIFFIADPSEVCLSAAMFLVERFYDVLLSVYIYNERRGYTYLDRLGEVFAEKYPTEKQFIASIRKHASDERHHHSLFKSYFESRERLPLAVSKWYGYCDQMVGWIFGKSIDQLDPNEVVQDDKAFFRLCRLIMITELRGMQQVQLILKNPLIKRNPELLEIFSVVKRDEPSHCYPYQTWLRRHGEHEPSLLERVTDGFVHYSLMWIKLPLLFFNPFVGRTKDVLA